jgi:transposase
VNKATHERRPACIEIVMGIIKVRVPGRRQSARRGSSVARDLALERMSGGMLIPPGPIRVLMATKPVDFRKGMDGLAALVKEQLRADLFSGVIFCFRAKRAD